MHRSLTLIPLVAALGACVADNGDEGIFITKNVAVGADCSFTASDSEPFIAHGTYAIQSPIPYQLHPQMKSRVTATAGQEDQRTIIVRGARVELSFPDTSVFSAGELDQMRSSGVTRFETLFSAPISPNGGITDGVAEVIHPSLLAQLIAKSPGVDAPGAASYRVQVIVNIVVFGDLSGKEVTSQNFQFPVTICNDCVVNPLGACPLPVDTEVVEGNACNPFQDGVVDCCDNGGTLVCPATVATMAAP